MTYADLFTTAELIRAKDASFKDKPDNFCIELRVTQSKIDLKNDLEQIFDVPIDGLNAYIETNADFLRNALACRQLFWHYFELDVGNPDSVARYRAQTFNRLYNELKIRFRNLAVKGVPRSQMLSIKR